MLAHWVLARCLEFIVQGFSAPSDSYWSCLSVFDFTSKGDVDDFQIHCSNSWRAFMRRHFSSSVFRVFNIHLIEFGLFECFSFHIKRWFWYFSSSVFRFFKFIVQGFQYALIRELCFQVFHFSSKGGGEGFFKKKVFKLWFINEMSESVQTFFCHRLDSLGLFLKSWEIFWDQSLIGNNDRVKIANKKVVFKLLIEKKEI